MAMEAWEAVIQRTGTSRFPIEKAREAFLVAEQLFDIANALADTEDEPLPK